jgi:leucyl aminopeptidase
MQIKKTLLSLGIGLFCASAISAAPLNQHILVVPDCLIQNTHASYKAISTANSFSLIKVDEAGLNQLIAEKTHQAKPCGGFINVTDSYQQENIKSIKSSNAFLVNFVKPSALKTAPSNYSVHYPQVVNNLITKLNPQDMWKNLTTLSAFPDRYAASNHGVEAANWLKNQMEQLAKENNRKDVKAYFVSTGPTYKQPSLVVKVGDSNEPGIVIGAHMDTLGALWGNMPGADDDGSGTVTVLEIARTLLSNDMHFKKPIYFIWYSAEEEGLIGSQHVVADFKLKNIPVDEVLHLDMTGYAHKNNPTIWLIKDNTNPELTAFLETLTNTYVKQPVSYTSCGYACSDHATWTKNGFKSALPFEAEFGSDNPSIHTAQDTLDLVSLSHMTDFTKLGLAFVVELAQPI